jgi:hypothetical protein
MFGEHKKKTKGDLKRRRFVNGLNKIKEYIIGLTFFLHSF